MKRQGKGHVAGSGGNGAGHGKHKTQTGGGELGGRGSLLLGDPGVRRNGGLSKGEVKRPNASVLQEKHRPSAIPAAAWDLLGGGIEQTRQAIWQAANEETGASLQDNHAAVGFTGRGEQARPPLQAAVSYLPPPRARPEVGSTTAADFGSEGGRGRDSHWAWRTTKAEKDSSQRAFTADLNRILAQADVLLEVLDARDPDGCRTRKVEEHVHATRPELKIVLVLNKIDLVPPHVTAAWVRHLKADYPVVLFKASTRVHNGKVLAHARTRPDTATDKQLSTGDCVGAEQLLQVLKAMSRTDAGFGGKAKISVGVVGQPNVGKSSLINSLLRHKATCTGDRPGVTKHLQALQLDKGITLLDSPGVVVESGADAVTSEAVLALRNCVPLDKIRDVIAPIHLVLERCDKSVLMELYGIVEFRNVADLLRSVAEKRGKLLRGGEPDLEAAARAIIKDWNSGALKYYSLPPKADESRLLHTSVVTEFAKEFCIDDM